MQIWSKSNSTLLGDDRVVLDVEAIYLARDFPVQDEGTSAEVDPAARMTGAADFDDGSLLELALHVSPAGPPTGPSAGRRPRWCYQRDGNGALNRLSTQHPALKALLSRPDAEILESKVTP